MSYPSSQLVMMPFNVVKPQTRHEEWFSARLSPYQPDKRRYVILDGNNETLTVVLSSVDKNRIDISIRLVGCQIHKVGSGSSPCELVIQWSELAPIPPNASYNTALTAYDTNKREFVLITHSDKDGLDWYEWISSAIRYSNILALQNMSRQPEVMEWYYHTQEKIVSTISDYSSEVAFTWYYSDSNLPVNIDDDDLQSVVVYISLSSTDQGLCFRINSKNKQRISRAENLMNGRVIKFSDISAVQIEALPLPVPPELTSPPSPSRDSTTLLPNASNDRNNQHVPISLDLDHIQPAGEKLKFVFKTNEDDIILESSYDIVAAKAWLQVVQDVIEFLQIPRPRSNSNSYSNSNLNPISTIITNSNTNTNSGNSGNPSTNLSIPSTTRSSNLSMSPSMASNITPVRLTKEFTANSSAIFTSSTDTLYLLHRLHATFESQYPILSELRDVLTDVWKLLSDIRFNREAITLFGERLEGIIRILGDETIGTNGSYSGIIYIAGKNFHRLISSSLNRFNTKLHEIEVYLVPMTNSGWLSHTLLKLTSTSQTMRAKLQYYDNDFSSTFNQLYKSIMKATNTSPKSTEVAGFNSGRGNGTRGGISADSSSLVLGPVVYDMASDIKRSIDAFGGIKAIYNDKAKIRALSRLVQCDASDLQSELQIILDDPKQAAVLTASSRGSGNANVISRTTTKSSSDLLTNQKVINFDSPGSTNTSFFNSSKGRGGRMSEGSYHKFDDTSVHYPSIYSSSVADENFTSSSHGVTGSSSWRSSKEEPKYSFIMRYLCCCLLPFTLSDGSGHNLLSTHHSQSSTTPEKFIVRKATKAKYKSAIIQRSLSETGRTVGDLHSNSNDNSNNNSSHSVGFGYDDISSPKPKPIAKPSNLQYDMYSTSRDDFSESNPLQSQ